MEEPAEDVATAYANGRPARSRSVEADRRLKVEPPVWPLAVVVLKVDPKHPLEVTTVGDEKPVQALDAHGAHPPLGVGVGPRGSERCPDDVGAFTAEHLVERTGELSVPVPDQQARRLTVGVHDEVAGLLGYPGAVGVGTDAAQAHPTAAYLDEEQHVEPPERHGLDGEEVAGHDAGGLGPQEFGPGDPTPLSRRSEAMATQDVADRGGRYRDPELGQLALDAKVAPSAVLSGQAHDQLYSYGIEGRPARASMGISPAPANGVAMPAQDGGGGYEKGGPPPARHEAAQERQQRPVGWLEPGSPDLAAQHVELVTEDHDLDVLLGIGYPPQPKDLEEANGEPVQERERHASILTSSSSRLLRGQIEFFAPFRFIGNWLAEDGEETSGLEVHDYATGRSSFGRAATASGPFRRRAAVGGAEPVKVIVVGDRTVTTPDIGPAVLAASRDIARGYSLDLASVWWLIDEDGARRTLARIDCWPFDGGLGPDVDQVAVAVVASIEERLRVPAAAIR